MKKTILTMTLLASLLATSACVTDGEMMNAAQTILSGQTVSGAESGLTTNQMTLGLKEALRVGTETVVTQLGRQGGFNLDPKIRIPLPTALANVHNTLNKIGMGGMTNDLQNRMNEAAELAVPPAKELFIASIKQMTIADARSILFGGQQDAATQYLRRTMGPGLADKVQPIIQTTLARAGAVQTYDRVMGQYAALPFVSNIKTDMNSYVTEKALDGIFYYVAQEEAAIRQNPAKRTTEILRTVFGR